MYYWTGDKAQKVPKNPTTGATIRDAQRKTKSIQKSPNMLLSVEGQSCKLEDVLYINTTSGMSTRIAVPPPSPDCRVSSLPVSLAKSAPRTLVTTSSSTSSTRQQQSSTSAARQGTCQSWKTPGEIAIVIGRARNKMRVSPEELPHTLQCFAVKFTGMWKKKVFKNNANDSLSSSSNDVSGYGTADSANDALGFQTQNQRAAGHLADMAIREFVSASSSSLPSIMDGKKQKHKVFASSTSAQDRIEKSVVGLSVAEDFASNLSKLAPTVKLPSILPGMTLVGGTIPLQEARMGKQDLYTRSRYQGYQASTVSSETSTPEDCMRFPSPSAMSEFIDQVRAVNTPRPLTSLTWQTDGVCSDVTIVERVADIMTSETMIAEGVTEHVISIPTADSTDSAIYSLSAE